MKRLTFWSIVGAIVCLVSIPVHAATSWMAVQSSGTLFSGGPHSVGTTDGSTIDNISPAVTFAAWQDQAATVSGNLGMWWWLLGVAGGANGTEIDGNEAMTLQLGNGWGANQLRFIYSSVGTTISISGFSSDPLATAAPYGANPVEIGSMSYSGGTLTIPIIVGDTGGNLAVVNFGDLSATAGGMLTIAVSGAGSHTALNQITYTTVPEPTSLSLLGLAGLMAFALKRKF